MNQCSSFLICLLFIVLRIALLEPQEPLPDHDPKHEDQNPTERFRECFRTGKSEVAVEKVQKETQLRDMGWHSRLAAVVEVAVQVAEKGLVPRPLRRVEARAHDERVRLGVVAEGVVEARRDGDGSAGGDELLPAFERGAHGAGMDEERLALVPVPVVGRDVDRRAGFEVGFHPVRGFGVVGEEFEGVLAVFGVDCREVRLRGLGWRAGEEGEHDGWPGVTLMGCGMVVVKVEKESGRVSAML